MYLQIPLGEEASCHHALALERKFQHYKKTKQNPNNLKATLYKHQRVQNVDRQSPSVSTCAASYVMVLVSVCTMGTSFVAISVFWAANVSEIVTISVFTTGGWGGRGRETGGVRGGGGEEG